MRLCLVGDDQDLSLRFVSWLAEGRGIEVLVLREDRFGLDWWFSVQGDDGAGTITIDGTEIELSAVDGAFVRLNPEPAVPDELGVDDTARPVYALERRHALHWLLDGAPFPVVNPPRAGRSNGSKPYQMAWLAAVGFDVPEWIVTSDGDKARRFIDAQPDGAVYKSCSGLRSHVRRADGQLLDRLAAGTTPVVVQRYIPGVDARVHTVGSATFATEIRSPSIDYRFDPESPAYEPVYPPDAIVQRSVAAARQDGLVLAGLDFRVDAAGTWWCLEMNPVPTFLPYEAGAGHAIGDAVLDLLFPTAPAGRDRSPLATLTS